MAWPARMLPKARRSIPIPNLRRLVPAGLVACALWTTTVLAQQTPAAGTDGPDGAVLRKAERRPSSLGQGSRLEAVEFAAFGRRFELLLQSNDRLKRGLRPSHQARLGDVRLYRGVLSGYPGSWARLSERANVLTGVFWDGAELYVLQTRNGVLEVERADDGAAQEQGSLAGDIVDRLLATTGSFKGSSIDSSRKLDLPADPGRTIEIGIVADEAFVTGRGGDAEADILTVMNVVDGIFLWQLGVQISIAELLLLEGAADPFDDANYNLFLDDLSDYKTGTPALASLGLVHLFTGYNIIDDNPANSLIGVAHLGTVCDTSMGIAITEGLGSFSNMTFVAAHEIAHNFGAPHDNQAGSPCESTPSGFLMQSSLNNSRTFSTCSIEQMLPYVVGGSCLENWLPNDLSLRVVDASDDLRFPQTGFLTVAIDSNGLSTGNAVELLVESTASLAVTSISELELPGVGFQCEHLVPAARCVANYLPQGSSIELQIGLSVLASEDGTVTVTVNGGNDPDPDNDFLDYEFLIAPTVDLRAEASLRPGESRVAGSDVVYENELVDFSAAVVNLENDTATDVTARFVFNDLSTDYRVSSPGATCAADSIVSTIVCTIDELPGGATRAFDVSFRTPAMPPVGDGRAVGFVLTAEAAERDANAGNNTASTEVYVTHSLFDLDLAASAPGVLTVGTPGEISISLTNLGPDPAPAVELWTSPGTSAPETVEFLSARANVGACAIGSVADVSCTVDLLGVGQSIDVTIEVLASGEFDYTLSANYDAAGFELNADARRADVLLSARRVSEPESEPVSEPAPSPAPTVTPSAAPSNVGVSGGGGGGGGALDALTLLCLLAASLFGRRSGRPLLSSQGAA